jgi:Protein of unknown function (DUF3592)
MVRRRRLSRRANTVIGLVLLAGLTIYGAVSVGLGISGFVNEHELATSGVPAVARVTATSGYGKDTIQVTYQVNGRSVQGTVGADPSSVYQGEVLSVVYDPSSPSVVSLAGDAGDTSSAWAETIVGAIFLLLVPVSFLLTIIGRRRRRRRAINAALGD